MAEYRIWICEKVFKFITEYDERNKDKEIENNAIKKLENLTKMGLQVDMVNIRPEGKKVFRIMIPRKGRIIGFYDNQDFIGINCFRKEGQDLNKSQRKIIEDVSKICATKAWQRKE